MPSMVFYRVSCFSGDLWSRGVFQHFTASHHFPRWIQFETGKDVLQICKYDLTGQFIILVLLVWVDRLGFRIYLILRGTCFTKNVDISTLTGWCNMIREMHVVHCGHVKKSHCQQQYSKLCFFFFFKWWSLVTKRQPTPVEAHVKDRVFMSKCIELQSSSDINYT